VGYYNSVADIMGLPSFV